MLLPTYLHCSLASELCTREDVFNIIPDFCPCIFVALAHQVRMLLSSEHYICLVINCHEVFPPVHGCRMWRSEERN